LEAYDQKKCPYQLQKKAIKKANEIFSPVEYASMAMFRDSEVKDIILDDCTKRIRKHPTRETLLGYYSYFWYQIYKKSPMLKFKELLDDDETFDEFMEKMKTIRKSDLELVVNSAVKDPNIGKIFYIAIPPEELVIYRRYYRLYGLKESFSTMYLFDLFDYVMKNNGVKLSILDATPNWKFLADMRAIYTYETKNPMSFLREKMEDNFKDHGSIIHQRLSQHGAWFPTTTSINNNNDTRKGIAKDLKKFLKGEEIRQFLKSIDKTSDTCKIGFTTTKKQRDKVWKHLKKGEKESCEFIDDRFVDDNLKNILWYGNQRGSNNLEYCDIVVNVGTYVINRDGLAKMYEDYYRRLPKSTDTIEEKQHGTWWHYVDSSFENFRTMFEEDEMYHAALRGRPHLYPVYIIVYGLVDERLKTDPILHYKETYYHKRGDKMDEKEEWLIKYVKEHNNHVPEKVAREAMHDKFGIGLGWAYEKIKKIVKKYDSLHFDNSSFVKWLVWEESE
jgi:hypothetical protein